MTHKEAIRYALMCSLEHHLCNVDEMLDQGYDGAGILRMMTTSKPTEYLPLVWEPYERLSSFDLYNSICDLADVYSKQFMNVLDGSFTK